jgi:hypothetical protein
VKLLFVKFDPVTFRVILADNVIGIILYAYCVILNNI